MHPQDSCLPQESFPEYSTSSQSFWNDRWILGETGWDIGYPAPAIEEYIRQYQNKEASILIPGCGNAYEAAYLVNQGFNNIMLIDIAPEAVKRLQQKFSAHPEVRIACADFFQHEGSYDLIIEQTFFCAIPPERRMEYAHKAFSLLKNHGKIAGLLFNRIFGQSGPPFGGSITEYFPIFNPYFEIKIMEVCYNSIPPRAGTELFILLEKNNLTNSISPKLQQP